MMNDGEGMMMRRSDELMISRIDKWWKMDGGDNDDEFL